MATAHARQVRGKYIDQIEHKPRCDTLSHNIDEEVCECHAPNVGVLEDILDKELQQGLLLLNSSSILLLQGIGRFVKFSLKLAAAVTMK